MKTIIILAIISVSFSYANAQDLSQKQDPKAQVSARGSKPAKRLDVDLKRNRKFRVSSEDFVLVIKQNGKVRARSKKAKLQMSIPTDKRVKESFDNSIRR